MKLAGPGRLALFASGADSDVDNLRVGIYRAKHQGHNAYRRRLDDDALTPVSESHQRIGGSKTVSDPCGVVQ